MKMQIYLKSEIVILRGDYIVVRIFYYELKSHVSNVICFNLAFWYAIQKSKKSHLRS